MGITVYPAPSTSSPSLSVPNWQLVTSSAPSGVTTVTFSGLSGYAKYRLIFNSLSFQSTSTALFLSINGNTTATNYATGFYWSGASNAVVLNNATSYPGVNILYNGGAGSIGSVFLNCDIEGALILAPKFVKSFATDGLGKTTDATGFIAIASIITSLTLTTDAGNFIGGSIYLLGAN